MNCSLRKGRATCKTRGQDAGWPGSVLLPAGAAAKARMGIFARADPAPAAGGCAGKLAGAAADAINASMHLQMTQHLARMGWGLGGVGIN